MVVVVAMVVVVDVLVVVRVVLVVVVVGVLVVVVVVFRTESLDHDRVVVVGAGVVRVEICESDGWLGGGDGLCCEVVVVSLHCRKTKSSLYTHAKTKEAYYA